MFTVQGDYYSGRMGQRGAKDTVVDGGNIVSRWSHNFSKRSALKLQLYYDRTYRSVPNTFAELLETYDVDFQHRFPLGDRQDIVWGFGYRLYKDNVTNSAGLAFLPPRVSRQAFSGFVQDEIALVKERLYLTIGTKIEHNAFTGFEYQPSGRLAWKVSRQQMMWGAISRAVRTPSRIDRDLYAPGRPPFFLAGGPGFVSEELSANELGYRTQVAERFSLSLASFYNVYDNLRSVERFNPLVSFPLVIANGLKGESYGAELTGDYRITDRVRLKAGYTEMRLDIRAGPGSTDTSRGSGESHDPNRQILLRSSVDFSRHMELDASFRFVASISNQSVPAYSELDMRWAWQPNPRWEFSIVGQNLLHAQHVEFGSPNARRAIQRGVYGKVSWLLSQK
jgi:iron complex outermembrane receptor protein